MALSLIHLLMERVQRPDGATSGVKVQPLSKGIGEGTVQRPFLGVRNFTSDLALVVGRTRANISWAAKRGAERARPWIGHIGDWYR